MFFVVVCAAVVVFADAGTVYTIDPTRSELVVQMFKAGAGAWLAHDHVVRATVYTGQIPFDRTTPAKSSVTIAVQSAALAIDEAEVRKKYALPSQLSEKDRQQIQATMVSPSQLDAVQYPLIQFTSTRIAAPGAELYTVTGALTIRNITRTVAFLHASNTTRSCSVFMGRCVSTRAVLVMSPIARSLAPSVTKMKSCSILISSRHRNPPLAMISSGSIRPQEVDLPGWHPEPDASVHPERRCVMPKLKDT